MRGVCSHLFKIIKAQDGDRVEVEAILNVWLDVELAEGESTSVSFSAKQARKVAKALLKAADEVEGRE